MVERRCAIVMVVPPPGHAVERQRHGTFGPSVQSARRLVQKQDRRVAQDGSSQRQSLLLAARKAVAALPHEGIVALRQRRDVVVDLGDPSRPDQLGIGRLRPGKAQVLGHGGMQADMGPASRRPTSSRAYRNSGPSDRRRQTGIEAAVHIVEPSQQIAERRLARPGWGRQSQHGLPAGMVRLISSTARRSASA